MGTVLAGATPLAIFEELRFVWEYLAAAFVLLAIQAEPKPKAALKAAGLIAGFSFVSLGYFPFREFVVSAALPDAMNVPWYLSLVFAMTFSLQCCFRIGLTDLLWSAATAYTTQHIVYIVVHEWLALWIWPSLTQNLALYFCLSAFACIVWYTAVRLIFKDVLSKTGGWLLEDEPHGVLGASALLAMLFLCTFGFQGLFQLDDSRFRSVWMSLLVCIMVLSLLYTACQKVISSREARASEQMLADAQSSLDLSHALFERLGSLMHDVRHIVAGVRAEQAEGLGGYLDRVEKNLRSYDATLRTHSEAINAALARMELLCGQQDITLACMAGRIDGGALRSTDLYALVTGIGRLAMLVASRGKNPEERAIDLSLKQCGGMLFISCDMPIPASAEKLSALEDFQAVKRLATQHGGSLIVMSEGGLTTLRLAVAPGR